MLVQILLPHQAVAADGNSLVGGKHHNGVVALADFVHGRENASDLFVQVRDVGIIVAQVAADFAGGARPGGQFFIANQQFAVVERVEGKEIRGQGKFFRVVARQVLGGSYTWIMRGGSGQIHEERLGRAFLPFPQKSNGAVGDLPAGLARAPLGFVIRFDVEVVRELFVRAGVFISPFAKVEGNIAGRIHGLGEGGPVLRHIAHRKP